ncbi:MAG: GNAT family N-acetyltransferase [Bacillota bacterium]
MAEPENGRIPLNSSHSAGITIRAWREEDFPAIQEISSGEGWLTPKVRPSEAFLAWERSYPALVAVHEGEVIGFLRALTDGEVTTYVAELAVVPRFRRQGIGRALIEACHRLCPHTRLDVLLIGSADAFYEATGFHPCRGYRKSPDQGPRADGACPSDQCQPVGQP